MSLFSLLAFAGALIIAAGAPGPSVAALVSRVLARGVRDVLPFVLAMWFGECIWISLAVFGLSAIARTFETLFLALKYAGIAYLLILAWKMWTAPADGGGEGAAVPPSSPLRMFLAGLAVTLGNPKIMVFYLALLPALVDLHRVDLGGWAALMATAVCVLFMVDMTWVALASRARRFLLSRRAVRIVNRSGAAVMAGAAVAMAARG